MLFFLSNINLFNLGARFGFTLNDDVKRAAAHEDVKSAIASKVSRERIGHEVQIFCLNLAYL